MNFRIFAVVAGGLAFAACADSPRMPAAPEEVRLSANDESNGVVESISGNADIFLPARSALRRMTIQARKSADLTVTGKWTIRQEWDNQDVIDVNITCFTIDGNVAYVGGVQTAKNGVPVTDYVKQRLVLVDNGEGSEALPDQSNLVVFEGFPGEPADFCENRPDLSSLPLFSRPLYDVVRGNLSIRK